jgi:hypothetical protein
MRTGATPRAGRAPSVLDQDGPACHLTFHGVLWLADAALRAGRIDERRQVLLLLQEESASKGDAATAPASGRTRSPASSYRNAVDSTAPPSVTHAAESGTHLPGEPSGGRRTMECRRQGLGCIDSIRNWALEAVMEFLVR